MVNGCTSGAMRQLVRIFQDGTLAGLSDREVLGRFVDDRDEAAFEVLAGPARADGPERLPPGPPRPRRRGGRLPGDVPGAGVQGEHAASRRIAGSVALPGGEPRRGPRAGQPPPACRSRAIRRARSRSRPSRTTRIATICRGRARGARSPARAAPGADRPVLPGRDDARAGRAAAPLPGGDGAQPDGPRPRPAPRADLEARDRRLIRGAGRRPGVERARIGRHAASPEFPGQGRDAARRRHRLAPRRVRHLGARRRSTGRSPERVESQAARKRDGGAGRHRGRGHGRRTVRVLRIGADRR